MGIFWTVLTVGFVVLIVGIVLWTFLVAPFWVPWHSRH